MKKILCLLICLCVLLNFCGCIVDTSIKESPVEDFTYEMNNGEVTITGYIGTDLQIRIPAEINDRPVTCIGVGAFAEYDMTYIYIPKTVKIIDAAAFADCVCLEQVVFTNGLISIGESAFSSCEALKECKLPESLTLLESFAFAYCTSLTNIVFPESLKEITDYAFSGCTSLTTVNLSEGLEQICSYAFTNCTYLSEVNLPDSLLYIESSAFDDCDSLKKLSIPKGTRLDISYEETHYNHYGINCIIYSMSSPVGYQSWYGGKMIGVDPSHPTEPKPFTTILIVYRDSVAHSQLVAHEKYGCLQFEVK